MWPRLHCWGPLFGHLWTMVNALDVKKLMLLINIASHRSLSRENVVWKQRLLSQVWVWPGVEWWGLSRGLGDMAEHTESAGCTKVYLFCQMSQHHRPQSWQQSEWSRTKVKCPFLWVQTAQHNSHGSLAHTSPPISTFMQHTDRRYLSCANQICLVYVHVYTQNMITFHLYSYSQCICGWRKWTNWCYCKDYIFQ